MRSRSLAVFAFAFLLQGPPAVSAQERITEVEYLGAVRDGDAAMAALGDRLGAARAERSRAGLLPNPVLSFEREAPHDAATQTTWELAWTPPFFDGRRSAAIHAADADLEAATHDLEAGRLALRSELRGAFAEWALAAERQAVLDRHRDLIERLSSQMQARARGGEESGLAARRLGLVALEVEAEAARAEAGAARARAVALALRPAIAVGVAPERPELPAPPDTLASPERADVLARRSEVEAAEWQLRAGERVFRFPDLSFGWQRIHDGNASIDGPVFGASWALPLFERQQPERLAASARLTVARARLQRTEALARIEVPAARAAYVRLRAAALRGLESAAEGDRVETAAAASFRLGESRLTDLIETLRSTLGARLAALELYDAALRAHRDLEVASGRPLTSSGGSR